MRQAMRKKAAPVSELSRDMYGFVVKPQHFQRYAEFASIYKVEEAERSERWDEFVKTFNASASDAGAGEADFQSNVPLDSEQDNAVSKPRTVQRWSELRSSLNTIARGLKHRVKKLGDKKQNENGSTDDLSVQEQQDTSNQAQEGSGEESEEEFYDMDKSDAPSVGITSSDAELCSEDCPWKEELQFLVRGGLPMALRGELWQVFVATKARRIEGHYDVLLTPANNANTTTNGFSSHVEDYVPAVEKWASQIEKDLPRTFPGHPALDEDGRNALRRLLTAYARHNPDVGYCQAMNFFAALLLLLMPEENAFWTLTGIMDDYFEGYYSEKLLEAQVDQLVLEELARQHFPKLLSYLDKLGFQLSWITGPWFMSIFVNVLPWESVLRVWDVLLFEGNRSMLFRTTLALLELHAPALLVAQDVGDLTSLMKTVAGATFDSSQLVFTACMGFQNVTESVLELLRSKHRPTVLATLHERAAELLLWKSSKAALVKKLSRKYTAKGISTGTETANGDVSTIEEATAADEDDDDELDEIAESELQDLQEQIVWLKNELCLALEDKKKAVTRAEELDLALMEIVKEDNRRELSAKVEKLEAEVAMLQRMLSEKQEQEKAMVQVMMRIEQEQKLTEDARRFAEKDAEAQRHAAKVMQEKYEEVLKKLSAMENRAVTAETMLEATIQYEAGQPSNNARRLEPSRWSWSALSSPRNPGEVAPLPNSKSGNLVDLKSAPDGQERKQGLFSLWRDRNKAKQEETSVTKENAVNGQGHGDQSHQAFAEENGDEDRKPGNQFVSGDQTV